MSPEKLVLIFALLGSAIKVVEVVVAMFVSASARAKAKTEANDASGATTPAKAQGRPIQASPTLKPEDQLARMMVLLESAQLATEEMKDKQADLLSRLETAEKELAAAKAPAKASRPRARKSTEDVNPQQQDRRGHAAAGLAGSVPPGAYLEDQERFEIVQ